jgi:hypothetical protein
MLINLQFFYTSNRAKISFILLNKIIEFNLPPKVDPDRPRIFDHSASVEIGLAVYFEFNDPCLAS